MRELRCMYTTRHNTLAKLLGLTLRRRGTATPLALRPAPFTLTLANISGVFLYSRLWRVTRTPRNANCLFVYLSREPLNTDWR